MKAAIAWQTGDEAWRTVRPPLVELGPEQAWTLERGLEGRGFSMPYVEELV